MNQDIYKIGGIEKVPDEFLTKGDPSLGRLYGILEELRSRGAEIRYSRRKDSFIVTMLVPVA